MNMVDSNLNAGRDKMELVYSEFINHINRGNEYRSEDLFVCGALTADKEVDILHQIVNIMPNGNIIEIGSWMGLSTITLALSLKERYNSNTYSVIAIDPHDKQHSMASDATANYFNNTPENFDMSVEFLNNIEKWKCREYVIYHRNYSSELDFSGQDISAIFIDGDHRKQQVLEDLNRYVPFVKENGYIAMHDTNTNDVQEAIREFESNNFNVWENATNLFNNNNGMMEIFRKKA